jgi:(1->4)-alpha-D-glucan 1-alpha-D-glucosylmutase
VNRPVVATYRLQLGPSFTFADAAARVGYLADLGVSHLYLSPILEATRGSQHGYDVVDPHRVRAELGGMEGFVTLADTAARAGLGVVVDVVPNHMAATSDNRWWWDVLRAGPASSYAGYFDIDWDPPERRLAGKVVLAVLGDHYGRVLDAGELQLERRDGTVVARYHEHLAPLRDESLRVLHGADLDAINADPDQLDAVLSDQHHRFVRWQAGAHELDYRRFFDIDSLIALRTEKVEVFRDTQQLILDLVRDGLVDGLRVDHIDGLRDPAGYLARLRAAAPDAWIVVEKIRRFDEELPVEWPVDGTTGYEHIAQATALHTDRDGLARLTDAYRTFTSEERTPAEIALDARREVLTTSLRSDLDRVVAALRRACDANRHWRDFTRVELRDALVEVAIRVDRYRAYARPGVEPSADDVALVERALAGAAAASPETDPVLLDALREMLLGRVGAHDADEVLARFQQLTGPLAAKGEEDTVAYRWVPYLPTIDVGSDPEASTLDVDAYHRLQLTSLRSWPSAMRAGSTHDAKRSEDVRARLAVVSERPGAFVSLVERWSSTAADIDRPTQWFLHQTVLGAHPIAPDRLLEVLRKSLREAKEHTSWVVVDDAYETAVLEWAASLLADPAYLEEIAGEVATIDEAGRARSLTEVVLRVLGPGVPDVYQGAELWTDSLVDPDNRRPVDWERRSCLLEAQRHRSVADLWRERETGAVKLAVLQRCLGVRRARSHAWDDPTSYAPISSDPRLVAFVRPGVVVAVPTRAVGSLPDDACIDVPSGAWTSALVDLRVEGGGPRTFAELSGSLPVAVLVE